ncbi:hypothetical protein Tco_1044789 [Tanacetum coccineum]|uniref:Zinc finger, CCHC-type n=1 Tax=Tanacetum coccineum TaxID=301880 RepID=A0ABQ5GS14_9ASTR
MARWLLLQLRVEKTKNFIELNLALVLVPNNAVIPKVAPKRKKSQHEEKYWLLYQHDHLHDNEIRVARRDPMATGHVIVLSIEDKLNYLEQPLPPAPVAPAGQHVAPEILAAHTAWVKGSKEIVGLMLMTMQAEQELLQTTRDFHACKQEEGQSVSSLILIGLRKEFDGFVQNYNMHSLGKTVNELHAMLKLHEQTLNLPKNNAPALHAILS